MMDNEPINTIIFDCDGTLVDSELLCNRGISLMLKDYKINVDEKQLMEKYRGGKLSKILESIEIDNRISLSDTFVSEYRILVEKLFEKELQPIEGAAELLFKLGKMNIDICVASNGPPEKIKKALLLTGLVEYFEGKIYSSYEVNSWKPDPCLFLHAAKSLEAKPENCLVVEDSRLGIIAANRAGIRACLLEDGKKIVIEPEYRYKKISSLLEVLELVG